MRYIAQITENGPLSFRDGRDTVSASTLQYVPGSALLGSLAATHTLLRQDEVQFNDFFLSKESSFGNLYPSSFEHDDLADETDPVYPLPTTARSCKRFSGFTLDEDDPSNVHGVFDALIPWTLFALSSQTDTKVLSQIKDCPVCGEPLDRLDGFYRRNAFDIQAMGKARIELGLQTRTGINRATGTVQQRILYSREVLGSGTTFWGRLTVPDEQAESFSQFVQDANKNDVLHLGNNRTRGLGRVRLLLVETDKSDSIQSLETRIQTFDTDLRKQAQAQNIETPHKLYLPLTLTSDVILFDRLLRYRTAITADYLTEIWNIAGAKLIYQNSYTRRIMGWNNLWRLPKPDDVAIAKGSVFLFGLAAPLDDDLLQTLLRMQTEGIGSRRREGFGRLLVASPFHWEVKGQ